MANNEPKQVIVMRKDLNMRKGKIAAQSSHASLGAILNYGGKIHEETLTLTIDNYAVREWLEGRFTKVCVSVDSEEELLDIHQKALLNKLNVKLAKHFIKTYV